MQDTLNRTPKDINPAAFPYLDNQTAKLSPQLQVLEALGLLKNNPFPFKPPE